MEHQPTTEGEVGPHLTSLSIKDSTVICNALGLQPQTASDLELLRLGTCAVFKSAQARLVVRVPRRSHPIEQTATELLNALNLNEGGAPVITPLLTEPLLLPSGHHATVWPLGEAIPTTPRQIGELLKGVHQVPIPNGFPTWDGLDRVTKRLEVAAELGCPAEAVAFLANDLSTLRERPIIATHAKVPLHGDSHASNITNFDGALKWIDLDDLSIGPAEVDLAPHAIAVRRFGWEPSSWLELIEAYGYKYDPQLVDHFILVRQLTMTSWLATLWSIRPETRPELFHRIETWSSDSTWTAM